MEKLFDIQCDPPWLIARFASRQRMASWSLNRPGLVAADTVAWLQVRDADFLPVEDPLAFLEGNLERNGLAGAVGLMTAREIEHHHYASVGDEDGLIESLVTLGLTNGIIQEPDGCLVDPPQQEAVGTINMLLAVSHPLTDGALLEVLSIAAAARTAALLADGGRMVGTGTDCIVIASPDKEPRRQFAGLHTKIGMHAFMSAHQAVMDAQRRWRAGCAIS
jgi:adenosylcobinamide amidohydrolase